MKVSVIASDMPRIIKSAPVIEEALKQELELKGISLKHAFPSSLCGRTNSALARALTARTNLEAGARCYDTRMS